MRTTNLLDKKPKPLSYSEYRLFNEDFAEWELRYFYGIQKPPTKAMLLGTNLHKLCLEKDKTILTQYLPFERRVYEKILTQFKQLVPTLQSAEKFITTNLQDVPTIGFWDGYNDNTIYELKTGALWNQEKVNNCKQLAFYALQHYKLYNSIPRIRLITACTKTGKAVLYEYQDTIDLDAFQERINLTWDKLQQYEPTRTKTSLLQNNGHERRNNTNSVGV